MLDDAIQVVDVVEVKNPRSPTYTVGVPDDIPSGVPKLKNLEHDRKYAARFEGSQ